MFRKTITLSIFALLVAVASCRPQVELDECYGRENGPHADASDANAFFVCFDDQLIVHSKCDPGEIFDAESKACTGGSEDQDLAAYSGEGEVDDDYVNNLESEVSNVLEESLDSEQEARLPGQPRPRPPPSDPRPPPPPPPPGRPPFPFRNKIVNIHVTRNIFPKSILVIGRANREQKNK